MQIVNNKKFVIQSGLIEQVSPLAVKIHEFEYDLGGVRGQCPDQVMGVTDNSTNHIYMDSSLTLKISTIGYPPDIHIRLGCVIASQGKVSRIIDNRPFLTAAGAAAVTESGWEKGGLVVRLTDSSDPVTIGAGSALPEQQLRVVGQDAAKVPVIIEGAPGQTAELLRVGALEIRDDGKEVLVPTSGASPAVSGALRYNAPDFQYHDGAAVRTFATEQYADSVVQPWVEDEFVASNGQVTFILSQAPSEMASFSLHVNGIVYDDDDDFTVSGTTVTWLNTLFAMDAGDKLLARYI